jgi:hypothetical protein
LDATGSFRFQASCCELCGALCSPLSLYYRDTSTVLFRVQQHCRKLVPSVLSAQGSALGTARLAQRGVLDVVDSLSIVEALNGPVERSLADVALVAQRAALLAQEAHAELQAQAARRDQRRLQQMNASNSLPTTPLNEEEAQEAAEDDDDPHAHPLLHHDYHEALESGPLTADSTNSGADWSPHHRGGARGSPSALAAAAAAAAGRSPKLSTASSPLLRNSNSNRSLTTPRDSLTRSSANTMPSPLPSGGGPSAGSAAHARSATTSGSNSLSLLTPTSARLHAQMLAAHSGPLHSPTTGEDVAMSLSHIHEVDDLDSGPDHSVSAFVP